MIPVNSDVVLDVVYNFYNYPIPLVNNNCRSWILSIHCNQRFCVAKTCHITEPHLQCNTYIMKPSTRTDKYIKVAV